MAPMPAQAVEAVDQVHRVGDHHTQRIVSTTERSGQDDHLDPGIQK